ncbi:GGDEF domain-containing protein [Rhizobium wuzhouense]|uniref:diguanylate cyclase n=1 Tax=Rhizobium wuzhouense TaxID=1986026 RepID=A0ABX5NU09_9HYPH|nr:GGDEF domain-containing protein [Rhizobium wuzhouense]
MLKQHIETWVIRDIGLTEFDHWAPVIRFGNRLSIRVSIIACIMVAAMLVCLWSLNVLRNPLLHDITIGCAITVIVAYSLTMLSSMYMGYAVIHLARTRREFQQMSRTDMLSGLLNRRAFIEDISRVEHGHLLILDIDRFKQINDRYGHLAGDDVIIAVAQTLRETIKAPHLAARVGGEEFAVLFCGLDHGEMMQIAEKLRRMVAGRLIDSMQQTISVTVSGGIADFTPTRDFSAVYAAADRALYLAKTSGRNRLHHERDLGRSPQQEQPIYGTLADRGDAAFTAA